ncbi:MAG: hypothetical protein EXR27_20895 [Betaproteobacteria bacterium]|nr:hypothetical protein [Betaproteobacteria bacterium]
MRQFNWDRFQKVMVDAGFKRTDLVVLVNAQNWQTLGPAVQQLLVSTGIDSERQSADWYRSLEKTELDGMKASGLKVMALSDAAREKITALGAQDAWAEIKTRAPAAYDQLRARFYK